MEKQLLEMLHDGVTLLAVDEREDETEEKPQLLGVAVGCVMEKEDAPTRR